MARKIRKRKNTRMEIIQLGAKLFIEEGYTATTVNRIATTLDLSPGNITFYFKSKEDLLAVLASELMDFQWILMEQTAADEGDHLLAYCLELTTIASVCEEDAVARDFFRSCYASEKILDMIRRNDVKKTADVFGAFRPNWDESDWIAAENVASGIEYATVMGCRQGTPMDLQVGAALETILLLYAVPEQVRREKIRKVLDIDYRGIGRRILRDFRVYIDHVNEIPQN